MELEKFYFRKVVHIFESFPLTTDLPNSDIRAKRYGQNTKLCTGEPKNIVFGVAAGKSLTTSRIWEETPCYSEKKSGCNASFLKFFSIAMFLGCSEKFLSLQRQNTISNILRA